jgi:hypothetical protein
MLNTDTRNSKTRDFGATLDAHAKLRAALRDLQPGEELCGRYLDAGGYPGSWSVALERGVAPLGDRYTLSLSELTPEGAGFNASETFGSVYEVLGALGSLGCDWPTIGPE